MSGINPIFLYRSQSNPLTEQSIHETFSVGEQGSEAIKSAIQTTSGMNAFEGA
jgi:hypothetical protein